MPYLSIGRLDYAQAYFVTTSAEPDPSVPASPPGWRRAEPASPKPVRFRSYRSQMRRADSASGTCSGLQPNYSSHATSPTCRPTQPVRSAKRPP